MRSLAVGQWEEERPLGAGLGSEQTVAVTASVPKMASVSLGTSFWPWGDFFSVFKLVGGGGGSVGCCSF